MCPYVCDLPACCELPFCGLLKCYWKFFFVHLSHRSVAGFNSLTIGPDNIIRRLQGMQTEAAVVLSNRQRQKVGLTIHVFFTLNL